MKRYDEGGRERWRGEVGMWGNRRETEKNEKDEKDEGVES